MFILRDLKYYVKTYDTYSKVNKLIVDDKFEDKCKSYTVSINGKKINLKNVLNENKLLFKKHNI